MKKLSDHTKKNILKLCDAILSTVLLLFSLNIMSSILKDGSYAPFLAVALLSAAGKVFSAFVINRRKKLFFLRDLVIAGVFLVSALLLIILQGSMLSLQIVILLYFSAMLAERIAAIVANHKLRSVILNAIACLLLLFFLISVAFTFEELAPSIVLLYSLTVGARALIHIITVSFAEMRLAIMLKIIRKTYAAEILFGLLLLMVAFSFVFVSYEESIPSFKDAMWYCFAVVTTIGFGDMTAATVIGRTLTVILGIYGIVVVALITSIIVNFYNEVKNDPDDKNKVQKIEDTEKKDEETGGNG